MALWKSQQADKFFGDLDETPVKGLDSHKNVEGPSLRAPCSNEQQSSPTTIDVVDDDDDVVDDDELMQRDIMATSEQFRNMGYLEAYDESKETRLQEGFEEGYRQFFQASMTVGKTLGALAAKDHLDSREESEVDRSGASEALIVARRIRTLLNRLDLNDGVNDQRVHAELLSLVDELQAKDPMKINRSITGNAKR